jgi:hypothetical protein
LRLWGGCWFLSLRLGFVAGLKGLQQGEVLLDGAVDPLLVCCEELKLLRVPHENAGGSEGGIDLNVFEALFAAELVEAESEDVVFDGAETIQAPAVGGDALSKLDFHGSFGREVVNDRFGEYVVGDAIFFGHHGDLTAQEVPERIEIGTLLFGRRSVVRRTAAGWFDLVYGFHFQFFDGLGPIHK